MNIKLYEINYSEMQNSQRIDGQIDNTNNVRSGFFLIIRKPQYLL